MLRRVSPSLCQDNSQPTSRGAHAFGPDGDETLEIGQAELINSSLYQHQLH